MKKPKIQIKKNKPQNRRTASPGPQTEPVFDLTGGSADAFEVNVRNSEPLIKCSDDAGPQASWLRDMQSNLASVVVVMTMLCLLLTSADAADMIPFAAPGIAVSLLIAALEYLDRERVKLIASLAVAAALIAVLVIFRKYIGSGWAIIMNQLYDEAEMAQAYIYDRFHVGATGEDHPYRSMHFAVMWGSALLGLVTAAPPARYRRAISLTVGAFCMLAFAYYGLVPSWVCTAVLAAALILAVTRGSILSTLTVLLAAGLVFGAVTFIDPGENYGISRFDENFRDRFALSSSYLDGGDSSLDDLSSLEENMQNQQDSSSDSQESGVFEEHKTLIAVLLTVLILAAAATAVWMFIRRLRQRQQQNRAGIDSSDPREAIVAMFPYAVRWLQPAGIEPAGRPFESLIPVIRADVSGEYADQFAGMYELWKEAAYSDHEMTEERRLEMNSFLQDTIRMIREKSSLKTRLVNTVRYAL